MGASPLRRLLSLLALAACCSCACAAPAPLRVVLDDNYPPYIFRDAGGEARGILPDLWKLWQQRTGIAIDFQPMDWGKARATMESGRADVIDTIFETEERKKFYDFSAPYAKIEVALFFHKSISGITDAASAKGFTIGVKDGDACIDYLAARGISDFKRYPSYEAQVRAAIRHEIRVLCIDKPPAFYFFTREGAADDFRYSPPLFVGEFHWAVAKGNATVKRVVDDGFARIADKERAAIERRWLGESFAPGFWHGVAHYGWQMLAGVLAVVSTLFAWNWTLRRRVNARTAELSAALHSLNATVAEQRRTEATLRATQAQQQTLIQAIPDLVWLKDENGVYLACNHRFERFFGALEKDIVGRTDYDFVPRELADMFRENDRLATEKGAPHVNEEWITFADDGHRELLETTKTPMYDSQGRLIGVLGIGHDITERSQHADQLKHIAHYDILTTLPNRVLLADRLQQAMAQAERRRQLLAVAYLDLDGFKEVNDRHGHDAGDKLLMALASRMKQTLRETDTLARLGGDEFVAVFIDLPDVGACVPMLTRLLAAASEPVEIGSLLLQVSASVGVTFYPQGEDVDADQLLRQSDQAMYQAKLAGKNRYHLFDAEHDRTVRGHHESIERIRRALDEGEFVLHYQPKVNMRSGEVIGVEALIRWQHPERGLQAPAMFLPVIEEHALAVEVGEWVIEQALAQCAAWLAQGLDVPVSVNVGARQLQQADFVDRLRRALARYPTVGAGRLELEVLETSAIEDVGSASEVMAGCRELGVSFSLDDFGTGYSSLTYLKRLAVNQLKIDQSFVRDMLHDPDDLAILGAVLGLATAFQRQVIAEGVETVEHGAMLLRMGCELGQGYGIARPMPSGEIPGWVASWRPDPAWNGLPTNRHDDLPLLFASTELRAWALSVAEYITREGRAPLPARERGSFARWLEAEGLARYGGLDDFRALTSLHSQAHALADELCALRARGRAGEAQARLAELLALRDGLLERLRALLEKAGDDE